MNRIIYQTVEDRENPDYVEQHGPFICPLRHRTIFEHDPEGNGAEDYMSLAEEITGERRPEDWQRRALEAWYMKNPDERPVDDNEN